MVNVIVTRFVDAALAQLRRRDLLRRPGYVPNEMQDRSIPPSDDWIGWKPIPSTVLRSDLDELETETGLIHPPLCCDFLQYVHFVDLTETGVRFEPHLIGTWKETLRRA